MFQHPLLDFHALLLKLLNQRVERSTNYSMDALMALIVFIQLSKYSAFQNSDVVRTHQRKEKKHLKVWIWIINEYNRCRYNKKTLNIIIINSYSNSIIVKNKPKRSFFLCYVKQERWFDFDIGGEIKYKQPSTSKLLKYIFPFINNLCVCVYSNKFIRRGHTYFLL